MATKQARTNPFASTVQKTTGVKASTAKDKIETSRAAAKQHLLDALDTKSDANISDIKIASEELSIALENNIFEQFGEDSKYKSKIHKVKTRLNNNKNIREALKRGEIDVNSFCTLDDNTFNDNSYFQSKNQKKPEGEGSSSNPPKLNKPGAIKRIENINVKFHKPPTITKPQIPFNSNNITFVDNNPPIDEIKQRETKEEQVKNEVRDEENERYHLNNAKSKNMTQVYYHSNSQRKRDDNIELGDNNGIRISSSVNYNNCETNKEIKQIDVIKPIVQPIISNPKEQEQDQNQNQEQEPSNSIIKDNKETMNETPSSKEGLDLPYLLLLKKTLEEKKKVINNH